MYIFFAKESQEYPDRLYCFFFYVDYSLLNCLCDLLMSFNLQFFEKVF